MRRLHRGAEAPRWEGGSPLKRAACGLLVRADGVDACGCSAAVEPGGLRVSGPPLHHHRLIRISHDPAHPLFVILKEPLRRRRLDSESVAASEEPSRGSLGIRLRDQSRAGRSRSFVPRQSGGARESTARRSSQDDNVGGIRSPAFPPFPPACFRAVRGALKGRAQPASAGFRRPSGGIYSAGERASAVEWARAPPVR
jgi:hypothetical protein